MDGSCVVQQNSNQDTNSQQVSRSQQQQQHQGASGATSLPTSRMGQVSFPTGSRVRGSFTQDPDMSHLQKKPRLDIKQEDIIHQQVIQQALHRQDSLQLQTHNPELQALIQQHRLRQQQQQFLQSIPPVQRAHLLQQQQFRQQLQQQGMQPVSSGERPYDNGVCSRRLMQYLYHQRQRPHVSWSIINYIEQLTSSCCCFFNFLQNSPWTFVENFWALRYDHAYLMFAFIIAVFFLSQCSSFVYWKLVWFCHGITYFNRTILLLIGGSLFQSITPHVQRKDGACHYMIMLDIPHLVFSRRQPRSLYLLLVCFKTVLHSKRRICIVMYFGL